MRGLLLQWLIPAVRGENEAKITIANSDAERREREAEALKLATAAEKVQAAKALEESYVAEQKAEAARAERERSTQNANIVVPAEIAKQKQLLRQKRRQKNQTSGKRRG